MSNQNSAKGNPASKRMSNPKRATRRQASYVRAAQAKARGDHPKVRRARANEALHQERIRNYGLGRRERRRLVSGVREPNTTDELFVVRGIQR